MSEHFAGKTVFVTGATGSFGHEVIPVLLAKGVKRVLAYSRDEEKQWHMRRAFPDPRLEFVIGDVRDPDRLRDVVEGDYVYHAAALKFVPTAEEFPVEAYKTNIMGSLNVREACIINGVEKAILVSTDKAVKPVNAYGMSKAMAEKIWMQPRLTGTIFSAVRYGNVLGSRGSIVPLFREMLAKDHPLPITDREMSRFFLTLAQAINLVVYATEHMTGREVFIPNNPACLITDLALAMGGDDYPWEMVGIRPGEKLAEILISEDEARYTQAHTDLFVIHPHGTHVSGIAEEFSSTSARQLSVDEIRAMLAEAGK